MSVVVRLFALVIYCFFFNDTATTEIYTLSLHDALPIFPDLLLVLYLFTLGDERRCGLQEAPAQRYAHAVYLADERDDALDRKSTRLNSSHANISYAVFCLKKKKTYMLSF